MAEKSSLPGTEQLLAQWIQSPQAQTLRQRVEKGCALSCPGTHPASHPALAALLHRLLPQKVLLVLVEGVKAQELFLQDLQTWLDPESKIAFFPAWEILPHESKLPHADVISERLETLLALRQNRTPGSQGCIVVANVLGCLQKTFQPTDLDRRMRRIEKGQNLSPLDLIEWLEDQGYEPEAQINHKGEIALRGGILDVYPLTSPWPIRIEFFGDTVDSLRHFDPVTQISRDSIDSCWLGPAGELGILKRYLLENESNPGKDKHAFASLLDYLPSQSLLLLSQPDTLKAHITQHREQIPEGDPYTLTWEEFQTQVESSQTIPLAFGEELTPGPETLEPSETQIPWPFQSLDVYRPIGQNTPSTQVAETQRRDFFQQLHRWLRQDHRVHVFCNNDGERQRFLEIWKDYGLSAHEPSTSDGLSVDIGSLSRGFIAPESRVVVVTDAEIFGRYKVQRPRRLKSPHAAATRSALNIDFTEFEEGDYVVHVQHGIGRFRGLESLPAVSKKGVGRSGEAGTSEVQGEECLVIEYAPNDPTQPAPRLFVPVSEAHLVSKYVGAGKARPPLNTLSGNRWAKAKAHAERAVRDLAAELLSIQAARESQPGYSFNADNTWQREFEGSFLYEETHDQIRAIQDTKRDMESAKPMDRLICGDVGYGKTEVAIRAAFKAVMSGKQVAIMVPTTVLAQQHYNTFRERMADYPVRVEILSRFQKPREIRRVVEQLAVGGVDIVIGTHRLVQKDIIFKDLGLVVIDEEQRFGVLHKERFKLLRQMVDVLTLSATPIPRTLHLALTGARDMSTIETPPQDRLPVETVVGAYDERVIRNAILRELNRQGQVFYLHNRVVDIESVALKIRALVPQARVVVGHGQMDPDDLERIMTSFINGEADVLLSTTIIESGIDIPNANTIIIDRADRFGLSDLYQLRGRVGRYKHQAYAYLMLPRHAGLLSDARKRISAIKQYSSLGSGFKIAMRDLEIRGAGNLLGPQQSGHITAVGFELYCQLLKQSVSALKGEKVVARVDVPVRLDFLALNPADEQNARTTQSEERARQRKRASQIEVPREVGIYMTDDFSDVGRRESPAPPKMATAPAYIPLSYIQDSRLRIELYRRLAQIQEDAALESLKKESRDRFGPLPEGMDLLFQVQELKILAARKQVDAIECKGDKLMVSRGGDYLQPGGMFPRLNSRNATGRLREIKKMLLSL